MTLWNTNAKMPEAIFTSDIVMYSWIFKCLLNNHCCRLHKDAVIWIQFLFPETVKLETDQI